jgi:predicted DCC family thiol-disulfide oxidoreductase YuxK
MFLDSDCPRISATATAAILLPPFLRDGVYDMVANNRYNLLGKSDECRLWDDRFEERFVGDQ